MPKEFFTEHDIEDMIKRGTTCLEVSDDIVLTELAYEKAQRLGLKLTNGNAKPPSAPERPYIANLPSSSAATSPATPPPTTVSATDVRQKIKDAVIARLGSQVDAALLDSIISRVLDAMNKK
jgi:hypothetical protein